MAAVRRDARIEVRRSADRFVTAGEGISTRHSFSFGAHYDPSNVGFGGLLAHNEDRIAMARGYDDHPHRDAEIVTWVLSGALLHEDSHGHRGLIHPRLVQRMSAGAGIVHAERNDGYRLDPDAPRVPVHFVQTWLRPDSSGAPPAYAQAEVSERALASDWVPVVSGTDREGAVGIGAAAATLWVTTAVAGEHRVLPEGAAAHLFVARGSVALEAAGGLEAGDAVRITGRAALAVRVLEDAELMVWAFDSLAQRRVD